MSLAAIQNRLRVPKSNKNEFGGYYYRSCEDILEAVKPLLTEYGYHLILSDEMVEVGGRVYVKATATLYERELWQSFSQNGNHEWPIVGTSTAYAREAATKKGMDEAQITGSASSYARKYALNGLFAIDDTKDADATNRHENGNGEAPKVEIPIPDNRELVELMDRAGYSEDTLKKPLNDFTDSERIMFKSKLQSLINH